MNRSTRGNQSNRRRGAVVVLVAVSLITLFIFAALAVDVGYICALTAEQQNNADATALAGAGGLQDDDWKAALRHAKYILGKNQQPQGYRSLEDQIIEVGIWNSVTQEFLLGYGVP